MTVTVDNIVSIENHKSFSHGRVSRVSILIVNFVNVAYIICTFVFDFSIYVLFFIFFYLMYLLKNEFCNEIHVC
jgi:hypothetical protein